MAGVGLAVWQGIELYKDLNPDIITSVGPVAPPLPLLSKGGKQNIKDTGLQDESTKDLIEALAKAKGVERLRIIRELKARGKRNKQKRCK